MIDKSIVLPGWFETPGAYVLVDGQYGSTGKGVLAAFLAEYGRERITRVTTNAGPNSGHTAYWNREDRVMTQQIPVASVFLRMLGHDPITLLNAGAVIDPKILADECVRYGMDPRTLLVHPCAAIITEADRAADQAVVDSVAGTGKGIGPAIARRIGRQGSQAARDLYFPILPEGMGADLSWDRFWDWSCSDRVLVEVAQGFSLGINTARFHPFCTSRECTVQQAICDSRIPAQKVRGVALSLRTYPIRVGNSETGYSGDWYPDQRELTWEEIGVEPELTTVTKRVRRVATWSRLQFKDAVAANESSVLFLNFAQYLGSKQLGELIDSIRVDYSSVMGSQEPTILLGWSRHHEDIERVA